MDNNQIVALALKEENLDCVKLARLARFSDEEIEFVKLFWEPAFNKSWIYLTKEMVVDWMGYKNSKDTMQHFYTQNLIKNYEENMDYKEVKSNDEIVRTTESFYSKNLDSKNNIKKETRGAALKKFYIITGECFKCLLMSAQTPKGRVVRKIYIKTEGLVILMIEVIKQQQFLVYEDLLKKSDEKQLKLTNRILSTDTLEKTGYVYITTTKQYALNNQFRIGTTENLDKRQQKYRVGRAKNDYLYYVYVYQCENPPLLEYILRNFFKSFRDSDLKDFYVLPWSLLFPAVKSICENYSAHNVPIINQVIQNNLAYDFTQVSTVPEPHVSYLDDTTDEEVQKEIDRDTKFRVCTKCNENKSLANYDKQCKTSDLLNKYCRSCHNKEKNDRVKLVRENPMIEMRNCSDCHQTLHQDLFFKTEEINSTSYFDYCQLCYIKRFPNAPVKQCKDCNKLKPHTFFNKDKGRQDGYKNTCKQCRSQQENVYMKRMICEICDTELCDVKYKDRHIKTKKCKDAALAKTASLAELSTTETLKL